MSKRAVLMMTFGSPEEITYEGVAEFFTNIRRGVRPEPHKIQTLHDNYLRIGGTPLQRITREEVDLVASALGEQVSVYFANKFSRPFITDVITQMENDGIEECLCLILEPHYSYYSVMGYEKFLESEHIRFQIIKEWYREPSLLHYWADEIRKILDQIGDDSYKVIFSAHSVPVLALDFGDPYIDQIYDNSRLIAEDLGLREEQYTNTWQSESDIGIPWIKPDVLEYLRDEREHPDHYIFVPIVFISEHIEVLFDNDVECKELCQELGVAYHRPPMPNRDPRLIKALLSAIQSHIDGDYSYYQPQLETFDELETPSSTGQILDEEKDIQMPDFVKKLIAKKGLENVKMPYLFKKMLEKKYGKKYD
ncbi:ferrochelatase [Streptococcus thermophilus]|uniref:ferrochelatase n=1 Tax=Streptococcus thermophilus TaxID=1308 RepID=UPI0022F1316C|nr:ferrochelatase [Streptococcus thermophilus]MCE2059517.1 ferrochelatase [Streptococcus thermophilus]MCE2084669.1 ferrochelatase [Streptococcus thermophilus]MDA3719803.1 ferrochelatase [Streptococcus thermophilus]MDA3775996.1 ferrochelatase [Streptococcus thermophilus]